MDGPFTDSHTRESSSCQSNLHTLTEPLSLPVFNSFLPPLLSSSDFPHAQGSQSFQSTCFLQACPLFPSSNTPLLFDQTGLNAVYLFKAEAPHGYPQASRRPTLFLMPHCSRDLLQWLHIAGTMGAAGTRCSAGWEIFGRGCGPYFLCLHHKHRVMAALRSRNNKPWLI